MSEAAAPGGREPVLGASRLMSDDRLARRAAKGDRRAFATIYNRYHQDLYRFCLAIVGNPQDAQDALQNAMVKVLRALPGEKRRIQLKPWLYRVAHNEAVELLRRRRPTEQVDPEIATAPASSPAETAEHRERLRKLLADLEELPDRQRGALVMRELAGLSFNQIGAAFKTSDAVARQTVYEARLSLRQMAEGREMSCKKVMWELSEADGRVTRRRDIQAHLRACPECRAFRDEIAGRRRDLVAIAPLPIAISAGLLHGLLGGNASAAAGGTVAAGTGGTVGVGAGSGAGGGIAGTVAAGAGKTVATSAIVKGAATVAVVAAIGATAADRGGLIETPLPSSIGGAKSSQSAPSDAGTTSPGAAAQPGQDEVTGAAAGVDGDRRASLRHTKGNPKGGGSTANQAKGHGHASGNAPGSVANSGHGRPEGLPAASSHGQQTAASHGGGHSSNSHSQGHRSPSPHAGLNAKAHSHKAHPHPHYHPPHPSHQAGQVGPDNSPATPLQPLKPPTNQGASGNASAHSSKEAR